MDIHKPKPWHGVREFLKEYVIIVVGVLTALGAEQGVEWLHWRQQAQVAREALAADFKRVVFWSDERVAETPCIARRIGELTDIVDRGSRDRRLPAVGPLGSPSRRPWDLRTWDSLVSSQTLAHIPRKEMLGYSSLQLYLTSLVALREEESRNWAVLNSLVGPSRPFGEAEEAAVRGVLSLATAQAYNTGNGAREIRNDIAALGVLTPVEMAEAVKAGEKSAAHLLICKPVGPAPSRAGGLLPKLEDFTPNPRDNAPDLTAQYGPKTGWAAKP